MKVLTATVLAWMLHKFGAVTYDFACKLLFWGDDIQRWAGLDTDHEKPCGTD